MTFSTKQGHEGRPGPAGSWDAPVVGEAPELELTRLSDGDEAALLQRIHWYFWRRQLRQLPDNVLVHQQNAATARLEVDLAPGRAIGVTLYPTRSIVYWCLRGEQWGQPEPGQALAVTRSLLKRSGGK